MQEMFSEQPLSEEEKRAGREGFMHAYQDVWRKLAIDADATPEQLGVLSEVVKDKADQLYAIKREAFFSAVATDGPWYRRRATKIEKNMAEAMGFATFVRREHPGMSEYEATDEAMDLIIMRDAPRTVQMGRDLAWVLVSDDRIAPDEGMRTIVIRAALSLYNEGTVAAIRDLRR